MPNNKTRRRVQTPKPAAHRTRNLDKMGLVLRNGDGPHKPVTAYARTPKHRNQGWTE